MSEKDLKAEILSALETGTVLTVASDHRTWPALSDASHDALGAPARVVHVERHDRGELEGSLPTTGSGVLLLSGTEKAMPPVAADAEEVLKNRRLRDWTLPPGWVLARTEDAK